MNNRHKDSVRLFKSDFMESMTHVHPIIPLVMWSPLALYLFYVSIFVKKLSYFDISLWFLIGIFVWTLTEYLVHRYVFHYPAKGKIGQRIIYLFHGIHHDDPDDATRLVMPPLPGVILMILLYGIFQTFVPSQYIEIFMASFIVGYLVYDYIHYGTHHFPMRSKVGKYLRKYHLRHHHAKEESKYGVSNPFWDYVFHTVTGPKKETK